MMSDATEPVRYRIGDFVNGHGLTARGWVWAHGQAPDGALVKVGEVHKGWKLTAQGWRPANGWEKFLAGLWFGVSF
jgi:hypothetical protein